MIPMISEIWSLYFKGKHCVGITALTVCYIVWYWYIQLSLCKKWLYHWTSKPHK